MAGKAFEHVLVVDGLVFLGMVAAAGMLTVQVGHPLGAVFTEAERPVGIAEMEEIHPQII